MKTSKLRSQPFLVLLFLVMSSIHLFSQSIEYVNGKVINSVTLKPLAFATIILKENKLGVFANTDGDFKIIFNPKFLSDSVIITCIGFRRSALPFKILLDNHENKILLTPSIYRLSEVKIVALKKKLKSEVIIRRAIRNISKNHPNKPFNYVSYYRDYQKKDDNYINLDEAIIQTLDTGFPQKSITNKFRLLDFRINTEFQRMNLSPYYDTIFSPEIEGQNKFIKYGKLPDQGGNELFILMVHDAIRNYQTRSFSFVDTLSKDFISNHVFSNITPVYDNNLLLYKIDFNGKHKLTGDSVNVSGEIYIQPNDYSIHKLEYTGFYQIRRDEKKEMFNVDIEYGYENSLDSLMCLKYISFNNTFNVVDTADTTYFRLLKSHLDGKDPSNSTFIFEFNNIIDAESAKDKESYEIYFENKKAKILNIDIQDKKVIIKVKEVKLEAPRISVSVRNIKDVNGNILNKRKTIEYYQYRELFVQEYNKPFSFIDSCYIQNAPLPLNCLSKYLGDRKYWMNTPLKVSTEK